MIKEVYFVRHSKPLKVNNDKNIDSLQIQNEKQPLSIRTKISYGVVSAS